MIMFILKLIFSSLNKIYRWVNDFQGSAVTQQSCKWIQNTWFFLTGEFLSSIQVVNIVIRYWLGDRMALNHKGIVILASQEEHSSGYARFSHNIHVFYIHCHCIGCQFEPVKMFENALNRMNCLFINRFNNPDDFKIIYKHFPTFYMWLRALLICYFFVL